MKLARSACQFTFGILAVLLAAGCSQATISFPEEGPVALKTAVLGPYADLDSPFTVSFTISNNGTARSVAGPDIIPISGANGIRNIAQFIVLD
jgi:hypothetical protein